MVRVMQTARKSTGGKPPTQRVKIRFVFPNDNAHLFHLVGNSLPKIKMESLKLENYSLSVPVNEELTLSTIHDETIVEKFVAPDMSWDMRPKPTFVKTIHHPDQRTKLEKIRDDMKEHNVQVSMKGGALRAEVTFYVRPKNEKIYVKGLWHHGEYSDRSICTKFSLNDLIKVYFWNDESQNLELFDEFIAEDNAVKTFYIQPKLTCKELLNEIVNERGRQLHEKRKLMADIRRTELEMDKILQSVDNQTCLLENPHLLLSACEYGDIEFVKKFLNKGLHVNQLYSNGATPLHGVMIGMSASTEDDSEDDSDDDSEDETSFWDQSIHDHGDFVDLAKYLIEHGANVNAKVDAPEMFDQEDDDYDIHKYETPLHMAVSAAEDLLNTGQRNAVEMVQLLLDNNADINQKNRSGRTPLDEIRVGGQLFSMLASKVPPRLCQSNKFDRQEGCLEDPISKDCLGDNVVVNVHDDEHLHCYNRASAEMLQRDPFTRGPFAPKDVSSLVKHLLKHHNVTVSMKM